jgi:hypothetical protein
MIEQFIQSAPIIGLEKEGNQVLVQGSSGPLAAA